MSIRFILGMRDRVAGIAFDDGGMNLLSAAALSELEALLDRLPSGIDVLCFHSSHASVFAAGADMQEMEQFSPQEASRFSELGQALFERIERLPVFTVAAIDGDCFGGALDLVLAFDLRVASPRSRFSHPGSRIGIVTGFGGTSRWRGRIDGYTARALFLGNRILDADRAHAHGIVDLVVDDLRGHEREIALQMQRRTPEEIRYVKELGRVPPGLPAEQHASFSRALAALHLISREH